MHGLGHGSFKSLDPHNKQARFAVGEQDELSVFQLMTLQTWIFVVMYVQLTSIQTMDSPRFPDHSSLFTLSSM